MPYEVGQGDIWGRLGSSVGKGLAESVPQEIERSRLASGLSSLANQKDLTPEQYLAKAYSIPGMNPEMARQFGELARYRAQAKELGNVNPKDFFEGQRESPPASAQTGPVTSTKPGLFQKVVKGLEPLSAEQEESEAAKEYARRPGFHMNKPENALNYIRNREIQKQANYRINQETLRIQEEANKKVTDSLENQFKKLSGADYSKRVVPADLYSKREEEALQSIKPVDEEGLGYDAQQASKVFGEKLRQDDERYRKIKAVGGAWSAGGRNADTAIETLKSLAKQSAKEDDSKNFAKEVQVSSGASPWLSNAIAYDINKSPVTNNTIKKLPDISKNVDPFLGNTELTLDASENILLSLAKEMKEKKGNPPSLLAIGYYLRKKGYDPEIYKQYMLQNVHKLPNLKQWQIDELNEPTTSYTPLTDLWLEQYK